MTTFPALPKGPVGRYPYVRPAYRILTSAHASVRGLFDAVDVVDSQRRAGNKTAAGRTSHVEGDVIRSAMVMTSAGLDAAMKRLVWDAGGKLASTDDVPARQVYLAYLQEQLKAGAPAPMIRAVKSKDATEALLRVYLADKAKSSFQGSGDLTTRVKKLLCIPDSQVSDSDLEQLDDFFKARNKISHDMDLKNPTSNSKAREKRTKDVAVAECSLVFEVAVKLIRGAAYVFDQVPIEQAKAAKEREARERKKAEAKQRRLEAEASAHEHATTDDAGKQG